MAVGRNPFRRIKLVYRRSSTLLKCAILATIVVSTAALMVLRYRLADIQQDLEAARSEAAQLEQENKELARYINELGTVQSVKDLAGKFLGLVDPDTVIFIPEQ